MVLPVPGGRGGWSFRVAGFAVRVDPLFVAVMGVLGLTAGAGIGGALVFVAVAFVGVLLHELGHAVAARASGHRAAIVLYGFGGATTHSGPRLSRARQALVSVAGPAVGLALGGLLLLARPGLPDEGYPGFAVSAALLLTVGLSLLNLLPVLPLDGGQLLAALLPGDEVSRRRRAAAVGLAVVGLLAAWALSRGQTATLLLALWLGWANVTTLREAPAPVGAVHQLDRRLPDPLEVERAAVALVDAGRPDHAAHLLATAGVEVDPRVGWLVAACAGDAAAYAQLHRAVDARPDDVGAGSCFVRAAVARGDFDAVLRARLVGQEPMLAWASAQARHAGRPDVADRLAGHA